MPLAQISIAAGRSPEAITRMAKAVSAAIAESLDAPLETVRVLVTEVSADRWFAGGDSLRDRQTRT